MRIVQTYQCNKNVLEIHFGRLKNHDYQTQSLYYLAVLLEYGFPENYLVPHSRIYEKITVAQLVKKFSAFVEPKGLLFHAIIPFQSSPYPHTPLTPRVTLPSVQIFKLKFCVNFSHKP
jgi:hypothetical protein